MVSFLFNPKLRDGSLSSSYLFAARWAALYCLDYQSDWWKRARKMSLSMAEIIRKKPWRTRSESSETRGPCTWWPLRVSFRSRTSLLDFFIPSQKFCRPPDAFQTARSGISAVQTAKGDSSALQTRLPFWPTGGSRSRLGNSWKEWSLQSGRSGSMKSRIIMKGRSTDWQINVFLTHQISWCLYLVLRSFK